MNIPENLYPPNTEFLHTSIHKIWFINFNAFTELFSLVKLPDKTKVAKDVVTCSSKTPVRRQETFFFFKCTLQVYSIAEIAMTIRPP